jgi:hypothetical protein
MAHGSVPGLHPEKNLLKEYPSMNCLKAVGVLALAVFAAGPVMGEPPGKGFMKPPSKGFIELPTKEVIAARSAGAPVALPFDNPKVAPGRVSWHTSFAVACKASRVSGKPVLLFQMMGRLDEQFC